MTMKHHAFTLIELLIVVAIIAILAAIAIPNFLQAQVRSKVSRVRSDLRTLATGMESYYVDWNHYPLSGGTLRDTGELQYPLDSPFDGQTRNRFVGFCLTAPIAYLSTLPFDPFMDDPVTEMNYFYLNNYGERVRYIQYEMGEEVFSNLGHRYEIFGEWMLYSAGPMGDRGATTYGRIGNNLIMGVYDPTNGVISAGNIIRSQTGYLSD